MNTWAVLEPAAIHMLLCGCTSQILPPLMLKVFEFSREQPRWGHGTCCMVRFPFMLTSLHLQVPWSPSSYVGTWVPRQANVSFSKHYSLHDVLVLCHRRHHKGLQEWQKSEFLFDLDLRILLEISGNVLSFFESPLFSLVEYVWICIANVPTL